MNPKPQSEEYRALEALLGEVLKVSKEDLKRQMEADKQPKKTAKSASRDADAASSRG